MLNFNFSYDKIMLYIEYRGGIIMAFGKKIKEIISDDEVNEESYYTADSIAMPSGTGKMILLEPRAFSESQQIADHLKKRNTVVVNMKRVTSEQAKRIIDFLSGTFYAIGGDLQKIGSGIFLCTPKNVNVEGTISDEDNSKKQQEELDN